MERVMRKLLIAIIVVIACAVGAFGSARAQEAFVPVVVPSVDEYDPETEYLGYVLHEYGWPDADVHFKVTPVAEQVRKDLVEEFVSRNLRYNTVVIYCTVRSELRATFNIDRKEDREAGNCVVRIPTRTATAP